MASPVVIEHLDIIKNICSGGVPASVNFSLYPLSLQQLEEALSNSIVVAVTAPTHTPLQVMRLQKRVPVVAGVLAALVGVHNHLALRLATPDLHQQRIQCQLLGYPGLH